MKEPYEKPMMVTETIEIGLLLANGSPHLYSQMQPFLGWCPPCGILKK